MIYERYRFNNWKQELNESTDVYSTALQALAAMCNVGSLRDEMICDCLVCGITENSICRKLLQAPKLLHEKWLDICHSSKPTNVQLKAMSGQFLGTACASPRVELVTLWRIKTSPRKNAVSADLVLNSPNLRARKLKCCKHCGHSHIKQRIKCPAFGKMWVTCGKPNHFAEICRISRQKDCSWNGINVVHPDHSSEELLSVSY